jgi:hypothetical protein
MKIFDAHNWLRINDLHVTMGEETPQNTDFRITRTGSSPGCGKPSGLAQFVVTAYGDAHTREDVLRNGGTAYFNKPVSLVEVSSVARTLVSQYISSRE